jgi:hypothetical protein
VASILGFLEWDDDDLTPGNKKEGGLHSNLFDDDGKLKGSARFVPKDKPDPVVIKRPHNKHGKGQKQRPDPDGLGALI